MTLTFWILIGSVILIIGLISYKGFEGSRGGVIFAPLCRKKLDDFVENSVDALTGHGEGLSRCIYHRLEGLPHRMNPILHRGWRKVSGKIDGYFERLRGHHNIVKK